jgi:hypothetical protein
VDTFTLSAAGKFSRKASSSWQALCQAGIWRITAAVSTQTSSCDFWRQNFSTEYDFANYTSGSALLKDACCRPSLPLPALRTAVALASAMADYLLHEGPMGYSIFKVTHQADTVGNRLKEVQDGVQDLAKFGKMVDLVSFLPFE